jgi:hypothetical protein
MSEKERFTASLFKTGGIAFSDLPLQKRVNFIKNLFLAHQGRGFFVVLSPSFF